MKIHEYQAKQLLAQAGVPVPKGVVARTADEAAAAFDKLGGKLVVVKSQIHAGGRGKGRFKEHPDQAGVVLARSARFRIERLDQLLLLSSAALLLVIPLLLWRRRSIPNQPGAGAVNGGRQ